MLFISTLILYQFAMLLGFFEIGVFNFVYNQSFLLYIIIATDYAREHASEALILLLVFPTAWCLEVAC